MSVPGWCGSLPPLRNVPENRQLPMSVPWYGEGEDFELFWMKFTALAEIQKWSDDTAQQLLLLLFIDGGPFSVFSRILGGNKHTMAMVKAKFADEFHVRLHRRKDKL